MSPPGKLTTSILFGVRYMGLPEDFDYNTNSDITKAGTVVPNGALNSIHVATTNEMVGPQIGALFEFYVDNRWWVNVDMKAAIMNNHCPPRRPPTRTSTTERPPCITGTAQEDHTAFAEEIVGDGRLPLVAAFHDANRLPGPVDARLGPGAGQPEHQHRHPHDRGRPN